MDLDTFMRPNEVTKYSWGARMGALEGCAQEQDAGKGREHAYMDLGTFMPGWVRLWGV
ncbi:MAG: hypothetical protein V3R68_03000 [Gammaproteobacteria bacterium]